MSDDDLRYWQEVGQWQREQELAQLVSMYELCQVAGNQERVFRIAERTGLLNEFKQAIANQAEGGIYGTYVKEA